MAKELTDILKAAAVVRDETAAQQNTAERVGGILCDLTAFLQNKTAITGLYVRTDMNGVSIRVRAQQGDGQEAETILIFPEATEKQSGIITSVLLQQLRADIAAAEEAIITAEESMRQRLLGNSKESSAYTDPFISLGESTDWMEFSAKLDGLSEKKYMGRCRATVSGVTVEVYQFINSFSESNYTQVILGNVSAGDNGQVRFTPNKFNIMHRQHKDGAWTAWQRINNEEIQSLSNSVSSVLQILSQVQENIFALCDSDGNIALKYDNLGFDVAKISDHFCSLLSNFISNYTDELRNRIQGRSENSSAYTDPFISLGESTDWVEFSAKLDGLSEQKYMGRCRATVSGITVEVYQFINSFSASNYTQIILGNVSTGDNGQVRFTPNNFNILHRQHKDGAWSAWQRINDHPLATSSLAGLMSAADKTALDAAITYISELRNSVSSILQSLSQVQENIFAICDSDGNIALKYDNSGFDVAKISDHFYSLLSNSISGKNLLQVIEVDEPGLYYVDAELNVGEKRDKTGTHAINLVEYINQ